MSGKTYQVSIPLVAKNLTKAAIKEVQTDFKKLEKSLSNVTRLSEKIGSIGSKFKDVGKSMSIAGLAIATPLGIAIYKAVEFEKQMGRVGEQMGISGDEANKRFGGAIQNMAVKTGIATEMISEGFMQATEAGISSADMITYIGDATKAAVGGYTSLENVIRGTTSVINSYGLKASDTLKITDSLFIANNMGGISFEKLSDEIGKVAPTAAQFGIGFEDMLAAVSAVNKTTGQSSASFLNFRALMASIANPSEQSRKAIMKMNDGLSGGNKLAFSIKAVKRLGFDEWLRRVAVASKGSPEAINKMVGGNMRAGLFLRTLVANQKDFVKGSERMKAANGNITLDKEAEAAKKMANQIARTKEEIGKLVREIGVAALPAFKELLAKIKPIILSISEWMKTNKELVGSIMKTAAIVVPLLIGAGGMAYGFGVVLKTVASLTKVVGFLQTALTLLAAHPAVAIILGLALAAGIIIKTIYGRDKEQKKLQSYQAGAGRQANIGSMQNLNQAAAGAKGIRSGAQVAIGDFGSFANQNLGLQGMAGEGKKFKTQSEALADYNKYQGSLTTVVQGSVEKRVKAEKKGQESIADLLDKSLSNQKEKIDLFSEGGGRDILDAAGFATSAISSAVGRNPKAPDRKIAIGSISLPNVGDREDFISELNKISLGFGVA